MEMLRHKHTSQLCTCITFVEFIYIVLHLVFIFICSIIVGTITWLKVTEEHGYHQPIPPKEGPKNDEKMSNGLTWAPPPPIPSLKESSPFMQFGFQYNLTYKNTKDSQHQPEKGKGLTI